MKEEIQFNKIKKQFNLYLLAPSHGHRDMIVVQEETILHTLAHKGEFNSKYSNTTLCNENSKGRGGAALWCSG